MNSNKSALVISSLLVAIFALLLGFKFVSDHWADIKELLIVALVLGASFTVAIGGLKLRSGR